MPDWIHKPSGEIGVLLPDAAVIGRSNQALVALAGFHEGAQVSEEPGRKKIGGWPPRIIGVYK